jgi:hypothetical protein
LRKENERERERREINEKEESKGTRKQDDESVIMMEGDMIFLG